MTGTFDATGTTNRPAADTTGRESRPRPAVTVLPEQDVAWIRIDDGGGNVLGSETLRELETALEAARSAGAVLLTGRQQFFSVGVDLFEIAPMSAVEVVAFLDLLHRVRRQLYSYPRPLVVAVSGSAVGAGASIACCGDLRLGSCEHVMFALPEVHLGVPALASGSEIVRSTLSPADAARVLLFGDPFGAPEALTMGVLHDLVAADVLLETGLATAVKASRLSSAAVSIKQMMRQEPLRRMDEAREESHRAFAAAWETPETQDRIASTLRRIAGRRGDTVARDLSAD